MLKRIRGNKVDMSKIINLDNITRICKACGFKGGYKEFYLDTYYKQNISNVCRKCVHHKMLLSKKNNRKENPMKYKHSTIQSRATKRGIPYELTPVILEDQWNKQKGRCFYSGELMTNIHGKGQVSSNCSLDRINPEIGYVKGNIVWVQFWVNAAKQRFTHTEFINKIKVLYDNINSP